MRGPVTMKRILMAAAAVGLVGSLSGCVAYPSYPAYSYGYGSGGYVSGGYGPGGYGPGAYGPAYVYRPAPVVVSPRWGWGRGRHHGWRDRW